MPARALLLRPLDALLERILLLRLKFVIHALLGSVVKILKIHLFSVQLESTA